MYLYGTEAITTNSKQAEMKREIEGRGITRLCHMTQINNLHSILKNNLGLLPASKLRNINTFINDSTRYDGKLDYVSCSIEYPNYRYYVRKKFVNPVCTDWAILLLDKNLLCKEETLYCPYNASQGRGRYLSPMIGSFGEMFAPSLMQPKMNAQPVVHARNDNMPSWLTTYDQAEVMIKDIIPTSAITGIVFENFRLLAGFRNMMDKEDIKYPALYVSDELFNDFSLKVANGVRPKEILIDVGYDNIETSEV